jgi:twinkle protein
MNIEWLEQFTDVIVWADNDGPGEKLASVIKSKLKSVRIIKCGDHKEYANALLMKHGENSVLGFINKEPELPNNTIYFSELAYNNEDTPEEERFETGFKELDIHLEDIRTEEFTVIVGRDGEGKSTFISQMMVHRMLKDQKTFLFSAELGEQAIQDWIFKQLIGEDNSCYEKKITKYGFKYFVKKEVVEAIKKWIGNKFIMLDRREKLTCKELIERMRVLAVRNNVKLFIIDNLQSALEENASSLYSDQANFAEDLRMFSITHKVAVILVAHPRKVDELDTSKGDVESGSIKKDDISGSKNMSNKAHNVISVERDFESRYFDMIITVLKDKRTKGRKAFKYNFSKNSFRYYSDSTPEKTDQPWKEFLEKPTKPMDIRPEFIVNSDDPF